MWAALLPIIHPIFLDKKIEVTLCNSHCEKSVWIFSFAYLDENSREGKYYKITNLKQGIYYKTNVGHTNSSRHKFPTHIN